MVDHTIKIEPTKMGVVLGSTAPPPTKPPEAKDKVK